MLMVTLLPLLLVSASALVIQDKEPDPMCPMVGLDCIFHDIERAYNSA